MRQIVLLHLAVGSASVDNLPVTAAWHAAHVGKHWFVALQVWKNDIEAAEGLLEAGVKPDVQDEESGW